MSRYSVIHGVLGACVIALMACGAGMPRDGSETGGGSAQNSSGGQGGGASAGGSVATAGGASAGGSVGAAGGAVAGGSAGGVTLAAMYPTWTLTDIQPRSPMAQQAYGLSAFQGRPVVAVLIEGF